MVKIFFIAADINEDKNNEIFCLADDFCKFFKNHCPISYSTESMPQTNSQRLSLCLFVNQSMKYPLI